MRSAPRPALDSSARLDDLVAQLTDLFREGNASAIDVFLNVHSSYAERLRQYLPVLAAMSGLDEATPDPTRGRGVLGDFRIVREVGRGGMGVVYEAVQISLERRVALKVLPFAAALDPRHLARFRVEAQAAALLHHANIVPIHAVGCDRGVHYYAMQFIDGRTLAALIDELRHNPAPANNAEFARSVAMMGLQAAEALDHAHGLGVIHRDVKPANLLLDATANLWVADFGLARLGHDAGTTRSGQVVGTLRYMTPEQALGRRDDADGRADVYALGATLYELLTLRPAFDGKDRREVLRRIALEDPEAPRSINPAIPRDLETIVGKALDKEPERRYASAREIADDLRRFLDDRPIHARRLSPLGMSARWARRHRAIVATAAATLLLACSASSFLLWRENVRTNNALRHAETARQREREALRMTFAGSDLIASRALQTIASHASVIEGPDADFCRRALDHYEQVGSRYADDPTMARVVAAAEHRAGFLRRILGLPGAEPHLVRAVDLLESEIASDPSDQEARKSLSAALDDLAWFVHAARGPEAAELPRNRALEVRRELVARFPSVPDYRLSVALTIGYRIGPLLDAGRAAEAEALRSELAALDDAALGLAPTDSGRRNELAWLIVARRGATAPAYRRAVELARRAVEIAPRDRRAWNTLGVAAYRSGNDREAVRALNQSLAIRDGGDPYDWLFLALARQRLGEIGPARELFDRSTSWMAARAPVDPDLARFRDEAREVFQ